MKGKPKENSLSLFLILAAGLALIVASCKVSPRTVDGRMIIADIDPIETAIITAQFDNFLGTALNSTQVTVSFAPRTDEALLQFRVSGNTYMLYLPREVRALVREAAVQYNEDFDERRLDSKLSKHKSERIYGMADGTYMKWGLGALAMNGEAYPRIAVGYRFENGSPYFSITVYSAENPMYKSGQSNIEQSVTYHIYMNKAEALTLAAELDEGVLMRALDTVPIPSLSPDSYDLQDGNGQDIYDEDAQPSQTDIPPFDAEEAGDEALLNEGLSIGNEDDGGSALAP